MGKEFEQKLNDQKINENIGIPPKNTDIFKPLQALQIIFEAKKSFLKRK